jgi:hypothetical protein
MAEFSPAERDERAKEFRHAGWTGKQLMEVAVHLQRIETGSVDAHLQEEMAFAQGGVIPQSVDEALARMTILARRKRLEGGLVETTTDAALEDKAPYRRQHEGSMGTVVHDPNDPERRRR